MRASEREQQMQRMPAFLVLIGCIASALALKGIYADGANYFLHAHNDPLWTDRQLLTRTVAIVLTTLPARIIGALSPHSVLLSARAYGLAQYLPMALSVWLISRKGLQMGLILAVLLLFPVIVSAHFIVSETNVLICAVTTLAYALVAESDDKRFIIAVFSATILIGTYEASAIMSVLLAAATLLSTLKGKKYVVALLVLGILFQVVATHFIGVNQNYKDILKPATLIPVLRLAVPLLFGYLALTWLVVRHRRIGLAALCLFAVFLLLLPAHYASRLAPLPFYAAYYWRIITLAFTGLIALLPLLYLSSLKLAPARLQAIMPPAPQVTASVLVLAALFGSVNAFTAIQSQRFWYGLHDYTVTREHPARDNVVSGDSGGHNVIRVLDCDFCTNPFKSDYMNLGWGWAWPEYSLLSAAFNRSPRLQLIWDTSAVYFPYSREEYFAMYTKLGPQAAVASRSAE
jgi:hypothetical protein